MTESPRLTTVAIGLLVTLGPVLVFPELLPPALRGPIVVGGALAAFALVIALLRPVSAPGALVAVLIVTVVVGWSRAAPSPVALSHFAGVAVGLLAMSIVAEWCRTERRLGLAMLLFLLLGSAALALGAAGAAKPYPKLLRPYELPLTIPPLKLGLPGLPASGYVNDNALAGTALLIVPVSAALLFVASRGRGRLRPGLGLIAVIPCALAGFVIYATQSRSAWSAALLTLVVLSLRVGRRWAWRVAALLALLLVSAGVAVALRWSDRDRYALAIDPGALDRVTLTRRSVEYRLDIMHQGVAHLRTSPWFGIGLNRFRQLYEPPAGEHPDPPVDVAHAHNVFLQTALDLGLVGLAAWVGLLALLLTRADQAARGWSSLAAATAAGAGLSLVAGHMFGLADAIPLGAKVGLFEWLSGGLILAAWRLQRTPFLPNGSGGRIGATR